MQHATREGSEADAHDAARDASRSRRGGLEEYRRKRDFSRSREPSGEDTPSRAGGRRYVIHKHAASRLHFDLRLEQDGVLKSWAVPNGPGQEPGERRLAVRVEDHPLDYGDFEGVIPQDAYGGGTVMLWDEGRWRPQGEADLDDGRLDFVLEGSRLGGAWTLARMGGRDDGHGRNWLLIKRSDDAPAPAAATPSSADVSVASGRTMSQIAAGGEPVGVREDGDPAGTRPDPADLPGSRPAALPERPGAQLATLAHEAPGGEAWLHELKFDGYRILARRDGDDLTLLTRNGKDWTGRFPEVAAALARLPVASALLDGEVVALGTDGASSFRALQGALSDGNTAGLIYQAFDLLHLDGHDLTAVPLVDRKRVLHGLLGAATSPGIVTWTDHLDGDGPALLEQACTMGLEGIVSKRRDDPYVGGRQRSWLKTKCTRHEELLIGGFTEPGGTRNGFGALLLGAWRENGGLAYVGKVGTGFDGAQLRGLHGRLQEVEIDASPFERRPPGAKGAHWVRPEIVAEVEFTEWTNDDRLRHPVFRSVRDDRDAGEIRLPPPDRREGGPVTSHASRSLGEERRSAPAGADGGAGDASGAGASRTGSSGTGGSGGGRRRPRIAAGEAEVAGVRLTSPDRVLYAEQGVTKLALARYYEEVADWILPHVRERPLSLVRCPQGREKTCFFQKHPGEALGRDMARIEIEEQEGIEDYLYVRDAPDLIRLVQAGVLELHVWGSRTSDVERPDLMVFDLDPAPGVPWKETLRVARELRGRLGDLGLASLPRTTGGKGLHVVVPLVPRLGWDGVKAFAKAVAEAHAADDRDRLTTRLAKSKRHGRIFLDYLRNGRGATAIASYSSRARENAPVAVPIRWDELSPALRSDRYDVTNLRRRLAALRADPWEGFDDARRPVTDAMLAAVGAA